MSVARPSGHHRDSNPSSVSACASRPENNLVTKFAERNAADFESLPPSQGISTHHPFETIQSMG